MRYFWLIVLTIVILASNSAFAVNSSVAKAGKYTVEISSQPSPPAVGQNTITITVKDGSKPLSGADVSVHTDMTSMPMPADTKAVAGTHHGEYRAAVNFSMGGVWKVDITIQQMAGMKMDGDGTAHLTVTTGKAITSSGAVDVPWLAICAILLAIACVAAALVYRRLPTKQRGYVVGTLTILVVLLATVAIVGKYRDPKMSTLIASATMDMNTPTTPGSTAVTVESVKLAAFEASVNYTGSVMPDQEEEIYPRVTGRLIYMPFYPGDKIDAGQTVAKLDTQELSAKELQAAYGSIETSHGVSAANADFMSSQAALTKAKHTHQQAKAQLAQTIAAVRSADNALSSSASGIEQANEAVSQAQSDIDTAQADVNYWVTEISRERKLYDQGAISKEELDRETAQAETAKAKLRQVISAKQTAQLGVTRAVQDKQSSEADLDSAKDRVEEARASVLATESDIKAAQAAVSGASARYRMANASASQSQAQLSEAKIVKGYTEIRALYGGIITARNTAPGTLVQPGMPIVKIAKMDVVRVQVNVSQMDLDNLAVGQPVIIYSNASPSRPIQAHISTIFPTQDYSVHTAVVEARVPNANGSLRPGQYLTVNLRLGDNRRPVLSVPTTALMTRDNKSSVFTVVDNGISMIAKRVTVTTGRAGNNRTEILSGLRQGDKVVTSALTSMHDGDLLTIAQ